MDSCSQETKVIFVVSTSDEAALTSRDVTLHIWKLLTVLRDFLDKMTYQGNDDQWSSISPHGPSSNSRPAPDNEKYIDDMLLLAVSNV